MQEAGFNPEMMRVVIIVIFVVITLMLRLAKTSRNTKPKFGFGKGTALESLREAMRQASEQTRARQGGQPVIADPLPRNDAFQQPSKIEPESSWIPSFLLLALLVCLCLMAYRYWAG